MVGVIQVIPVTGIPEVRDGDDLARLIVGASDEQDTPIEDGDILVVTQKIVSKAEGRLISLKDVQPSQFAVQMATDNGRDPRHMELILRESRSIIKMAQGHFITETKHGFICANSGIDMSNVPGDEVALLLPVDPDQSARLLRQEVKLMRQVDVAVVISDTFGRPWRNGQTDVGIGASGIMPMKSYVGSTDDYGYELRVTLTAIIDELAGAAELVIGKTNRAPAAIIKGFEYQKAEESARVIIRDQSRDMFR